MLGEIVWWLEVINLSAASLSQYLDTFNPYPANVENKVSS